MQGSNRISVLARQKRIGPRYPKLGEAGFHLAQWVATRRFAAAGFHQRGSGFAEGRIAAVREKLARGESVYFPGLGPPGTPNSRVALVEGAQAHGPRQTVNKADEPVSATKHTTKF